MERKKWKQEKDTIVSVSSRLGPPKLQEDMGRRKGGRKIERTSWRRRMGNAGLNLLSRPDGQEDGSWASLSLQMSRILKTHITSCQEKPFLPLSSTHPLPHSPTCLLFSFLASSLSPFTLLLCSLLLSPVQRTAQCQAAAQWTNSCLLHEFMDESHLICKDF